MGVLASCVVRMDGPQLSPHRSPSRRHTLVGLFGRQGTLRVLLGGHVAEGTANTSSGRGRVESHALGNSAEPKI